VKLGEPQKHQQLKLRCRLKGLLRSLLKHFLPHNLFWLFWSFPEELFFHIVDWYYCSGMTLVYSILWIYSSSSVNRHFFLHIEILLIFISLIIWSFIYNLLHIALSSVELLDNFYQYWGTLPLFPHWVTLLLGMTGLFISAKFYFSLGTLKLTEIRLSFIVIIYK